MLNYLKVIESKSSSKKYFTSNKNLSKILGLTKSEIKTAIEKYINPCNLD